MCVRKKPSNPKLAQKSFAPQTKSNVCIVEPSGRPQPPPALLNNNPIQASFSNKTGRESREKAKTDLKPMLPTAFGAGDFIKRRRDDDTLREVGNVMPEYDCDKDDQLKNTVEKTQETIENCPANSS
ncbi:hypothetical protein RB195_016335 [Necator americanus]|uniref:Uncharacterized protein n=1 Tax=Necator americanus TaxID=51031 RepID=A0ABR1E8T8_NECAM